MEAPCSELSETSIDHPARPAPADRASARRPLGASLAALALGAACGAGCQSYEPRPLDPQAHFAAWRARALELGALGERLEGLELEAGEVVLDPADGLSLAEGRLVALVFHPDLRLARLRAGLAAAGAEHAGLWSDPELSLELLRITESAPDRWVVTPGLALSVPLADRTGAERGLAAAELRAAVAAVREAEWAVWHAVEAAWIEWSSARLRVEETERFVAALDELVESTSRLAERGELPRTEAALFGVERAQRANRLRGLRGEADAGEQRLGALLGLAPEARIELVPTLALPPPASEPDGGPAAERLWARSPTLERLRREHEASEERLRLEIAEQVPSLTLGPLLESDAGQSRVGLLAAIPLPLLNANARAIAEARVARELARAALETEYERLAGRWMAATTRGEALAEQRADMEQALVPLVDRQLADAFELVRLGEGSSLVLLESLTRAHRTKLELVEARAAESLARAEVVHLIGPPAALPVDLSASPALPDPSVPSDPEPVQR